MSEKLLNLNVEIRDLPEISNRILNLVAMSEGKFKWMVIRDALNYYAEYRRPEFPGVIKHEIAKRNDRRRGNHQSRGDKEESDIG